MSVQGDLLRDAISKIEGDRNADYGAPHEDFERTAGMLNSLGYRGPAGREITGSDWAVILICGKLSRLMNSPDHKDSIEDIGGYAGCYWEAREFLRQTEAKAELSDDEAKAALVAREFLQQAEVSDDAAKAAWKEHSPFCTGYAESALCPGGSCGQICQRTGLLKFGERQADLKRGEADRTAAAVFKTCQKNFKDGPSVDRGPNDHGYH